ncbi:MAG: sugar phosphate nucleotidyltransferase [Candidatus Zixiibacteriota bacterium]
MKGLILSAGYGTRLGPLTDIIPKAIFPVLGRSFISLISSKLQENGISDLGVNLYHLSDKLGAHLLRIRQPGIEYFTIREEQLMGTGGGIAQFKDYIDDNDNFIIHNCDIISDAPLYEMIDYHCQRQPLATLMTVDFPPINSVSLDDNKNLVDICDEIKPDGDFDRSTFGGIAILSPEIFKYFNNKGPFSILDIYIKLIREKPGSVIGWKPEGDFYWRDVGSIDSYLDLHEDILVNKKYKSKLLEIPDNTVYKGFDVFVHANAQIRGFASLGHYVRVPKAAIIEDTVIWAGTEIPKGFRVSRKVVYKNMMAPY